MTSGFSIKYKGPDLDALAAELEAPVRPAAQAMAQVFYEHVVSNVGRIRKKTGNLARSIYQAYSEDNSSATRAVYHVSWNARQAPHGHLVEFGHLMRYEVSFDPITKRFATHKDRPLPTPKHVAARPFLRPALSYAQQALDAGEKRYLAELQAKGIVK